jgi:hypothetical protein
MQSKTRDAARRQQGHPQKPPTRSVAPPRVPRRSIDALRSVAATYKLLRDRPATASLGSFPGRMNFRFSDRFVCQETHLRAPIGGTLYYKSDVGILSVREGHDASRIALTTRHKRSTAASIDVSAVFNNRCPEILSTRCAADVQMDGQQRG